MIITDFNKILPMRAGNSESPVPQRLLYSPKYINLVIIHINPERCTVQGRIVFVILLLVPLVGQYQSAHALDEPAVGEQQDTVSVEDRDATIANDFALAVQLFDEGDFNLAMDHFRSIIESHPQTSHGIESRYYLGMVYRRLGQPENARMTLQTFALTFPDHRRAPDAWWNIAEILASQQRYNDAGFALERLLQFHSDHGIVPRALLQASVYFEKAGDRRKSDEYLRRIILQHSSSDVILDARLQFGMYRLDEGEYAQAGAVFRRIITDLPERATDERSVSMRAEAVFGLARAYHYQRIFDKAHEEYERVIQHYEQTPSYPKSLLHRAELYQQQGQHLDAVDLFRRAQRFVDGFTDEDLEYIARRALLGIAESYNALGDFSSAATFFDLYARRYAGTALKEELITIWQGAARSNEGMHNYHRAVEWWDRLIDIDPPDEVKEEAFIRSAMNHTAARNYNEAAERLRKYSEKYHTPQAAEALFRLGSLYEEQLNDPRRALAALEELAYRFPESQFIDNAVYGQAQIQLKIGNDRPAYHIMREFEQRFPGSSLTAEARRLRHELEAFHLQDRDGGFQSITMLMSEMIAGAPRGELAFQLGDIYLNKLKQYSDAARQFETALSMDLPEDKKTHAEYLYAYSLYRMAQQSENRRSEALAKLRDLSDRSARSPNIETITFYHVEILRMVAGPAEFINAAEKYIESFPRSEHALAVRLAYAETLEQIDEQSNALEIYRHVVNQYEDYPASGDALMRLAYHHLAAGEAQEAAEYFTAYIRGYPNGAFIADATLNAAGLYYRSGRYEEAIDLFRQFVRNYYYHDQILDVKKELARVLLRDNRHRDAFELFENIITQYRISHFKNADVPDDMLYFAALAAYRMGSTEDAIDYFEQFFVRDYTSERAGITAILLGELYNRQGKIQISEFYAHRASEIITSGLANEDIADILYSNGRYEKAVPHLQAVAEQAESEEIQRLYRKREIIALLRSGKVDEARRRIEVFRSDFPRERELLIEFEFETAMRQFRNRAYDNAVRSFQQFIQQHQRHEKTAYAHFYLGRSWEAVGRRTDAKRKYEEIFEKFPESSILPDVHLAYAGLLLNEEKFIEAIDHYRIIVQTASDDDDLMYYTMPNLAQAYEEIGFNEAALELIEEFIRRYPNDPKALDMHVRIGTLYQRAQLYERSIEKFQSLILFAERPLETELRYYTGDSFHMLGNYQRAIQEFKTVTELDPRTTQLDWTATALYMAGQSYEQMGEPAEAIAMYQEIIDRRGIEGQYKAAARREIDRVRAATSQSN
jgi:TolA-binding protein